MTTVDSWPKTLPMPSAPFHYRNSSTVCCVLVLGKTFSGLRSQIREQKLVPDLNVFTVESVVYKEGHTKTWKKMWELLAGSCPKAR